MTDAEHKQASALEHLKQCGSAVTHRRDGLWGAYRALARQGKITLTPIGGGTWGARLKGAMLESFLVGEEIP